MKAKIVSKTLLILGLVFVLGSASTQVRGQGVVTINSTGDVTGGKPVHSYCAWILPQTNGVGCP